MASFPSPVRYKLQAQIRGWRRPAAVALLALTALCAPVSEADATGYTWTGNSAGIQNWSLPGNWAGALVDSGPGTNTDTLTFFSDTVTALASGSNLITTGVPSALTLNGLSLNGKGASLSGPTNITIGANASTWTLGGTSPAVNLAGVNGTQALNYTIAPNLVLTATTAFQGAGTAGFNFAGNISGAFGIAKSGASALTLSGSNSFTGGILVSGGALVLKNSYAAGTGAISFSGFTLKLDNSGTGQNIWLTNGVTSNGSTYVNVAGDNKIAGSLSINSGASNTYLQVDAGSLEFSGGYGAGTTGRAAHLQGAAYGLYSGNIAFGDNTLDKTGSGTWMLTGANSYIRATTVSAGTLIPRSANALGTSPVTVSANANLSYVAVSDTTLNLASTLAINGGASTVIGASIGSSATSAEIKVAGNATATAAAVKVNVYGMIGMTPLSGSNIYTLVHGGGAANTLNLATYTLGTVYNNTNFTVGTPSATATDLQVGITSQTALTTAFWKGGLTGATNVWAASNGSTQSNWTAVSGGGVQGLVPGVGADVTISNSAVTTAPTSTYLGADMAIKSLTIADTTNGLGLGSDFFTLTISPTDPTSGITVNSSVPACTIAARVRLGAAQTWTNNSSNALTVSGAVSGSGSLTKAGSGPLILSGDNTYTGNTAVNGGILSLSQPTLPDGAAVYLTTGATLNLAHSQVDLVQRLIIDGVEQPSGKWGAPGSVAAMLADHETPCISGAGVLSVLCGPEPTPATVDPAGTPFVGTLSSEFNGANGFEGWTTSQVTGAAVGDGVLSATSSSSTPLVSLLQIANGPDLDLGFNDYLEIRIQVPAGYQGDIRFFYRAISASGAISDGVFSIPAASVAKDGAFHTYRIDLGLERAWRGILTDLQIQPVNAAGLAFAIDYVRIGDLPEDVYLPNTTDQPVSDYELSSKHFRFIWNATRASTGMDATKARGCLRNIEEVWQVYVKLLGYREPAQSTDTAVQDGNKYKVNFLCIYDGYWMGGSPTRFGYLNIEPSGLQVDPPGWVVPHELMHVFQMHNSSGYVPGSWWETHANYGRERWINYYRYLFTASPSGIDAQCIRDAHMRIAMGRNYYLTWPFFLYVDENPDGLPDLFDGMVVKIWQETLPDEYSMATLDRLTPITSLKDIVGYYARRGATMNYAHKADMNAALATQDPAKTARHQFTDLVRRSDDPAWWRVPFDKAPMQGAYAIHELVPAGTGEGRMVTVNLRGLADAARGADWRASFIAISDAGVERYTPLWSGSASSITLYANENKLYLSVAGTPDSFAGGEIDQVAFPYQTDPSKARFPYELQVFGATPRERDNGATTGLVQHANGGGWKASTATVDATAFIGPNARVLGAAQVRNSARIEDYGVVEGTAQVLNSAIVSGHAWVRNNAIVRDNARVRDWAIVEGATVMETGRVFEHATVSGTVAGTATAKGSAIFSGTGTLSGNAIVDGDYYLGRNIANGIAFGHQPYVGVPDSYITPTPAWLYAAYDFATAHDSRALDKYGVTDGYLIGSPTWVAADAKRNGFLTFDGATQNIILDRSIADTQQFTFTAWVRPAGGVANQCVLWLGTSTTQRLCFTPDDGAGHAKFSISNNSGDQTLAAPGALSPGLWTHVAVALDGTTGTLFLNGTSVASSSIAIVPEQLLGANTATAAQHNYLARSEAAAMPRFRGALDDVQFYTHVLAAADIASMIASESSTSGTRGNDASAGTVYVDLRARDASAGASAWVNNGTLGNFSRTGSPTKVDNVLGSGFPGVQFNGVDQAYTGPNTVADIDGGGDRTVEVWAWNPALDAEETVVSWGHRGDTLRDMAFNFGSNTSWGAATHWDVDLDWGSAPPSAGAWHHLAYTYDGAVVRVYIDGALANSRTMSIPLNTWPGEPLNLACQRESANGSRSHYFSGYLNSVRVLGGVLSAAQIAANAALGPVGALPNTAPSLGAVSNQTLDYGASSGPISLVLSDSDTAPEALLLSGSAGNTALLDPAGMVFSGTGASRTLVLTPTPGLFGTTTVFLSVGDGAASGTTSFTLTVLSPEETWRKTNFGSTANAGAASRAADPDRDGLSNFMEFATGSDPNAPGIPPQSLTKNGTNLEYVYTRSQAALDGGCSFTVEYSEVQPLIFDDGRIQIVKVLVPAGSNRRFVRLRVNQP